MGNGRTAAALLHFRLGNSILLDYIRRLCWCATWFELGVSQRTFRMCKIDILPFAADDIKQKGKETLYTLMVNGKKSAPGGFGKVALEVR